MGPRRLGLLGAAIAFARSEQGKRMIRQARERYDTPQNRARIREALANRQTTARRQPPRRSTP